MKIDVNINIPSNFKPAYEGQFDMFSHLELTASIPQVLFAITTWKENGKPNVCLHSWSCFHGDSTAFFAVIGGLYQGTHTYKNICRDKSFCINFLPISYYDNLISTINNNDYDADEFEVGGFTLENGRTVSAPVIKESFLCMECTLKETSDLSGAGITSMVIGQVQNILVEEAYASEYGKRYGEDGFMLLIPGMQNLKTGEQLPERIAIVDIKKQKQWRA